MQLKNGLVILTVVVLHGATLAVAETKPKPKPTIPNDPILQQLLLSTNADPDTGDVPLKVKFEAEVYEGDEAVKPKYEWDFGDGSAKSHEQNPTHTYKKVGKYTAQVTVKDATGRGGHDNLDIYGEAPE